MMSFTWDNRATRLLEPLSTGLLSGVYCNIISGKKFIMFVLYSLYFLSIVFMKTNRFSFFWNRAN